MTAKYEITFESKSGSGSKFYDANSEEEAKQKFFAAWEGRAAFVEGYDVSAPTIISIRRWAKE